MTRHSIEATVCGLILLACRPPEAPTPGLTAALVQTCAPWDGAAIALYLTDRPALATYPEPPYLAITVYRSVSDVLGREFVVGPETQNLGQGQICLAAGECHPAQTASVRFGGLGADSTVEVTYRLALGPDSVITGRGRARLHPAPGLCG